MISLEETRRNKHYFQMNFIFRSYPAHPWLADWTLEPRDCSASFRTTGAGRFFRTQETVGQVIPNEDEAGWAFQVPVPQNSRVNILFNGFCAYFDKKGKQIGAEVLTPEPGILWGRFAGIPEPAIATDIALEQEGIFQWLETDSGLVLLASKDDQFCLVNKSPFKAEAIRTAESFLARDLLSALQNERSLRTGTQDLLEEMSHHDALAVISAESMMKALRPPEGAIPLHWCQSSSSDHPMMNVNELFTLAQAWRLMDIKMAEELVLCALKCQTNAGAIAVEKTPHTTQSLLEAPKPLLSQTAEAVYETGKSNDFLSTALPLLRRHLQWLLHHFDPKRQGIFCWKNPAESLQPELYQTDLVTADLAAMLISEVDALNRLRRAAPDHSEGPDWFEQERNSLEHNLMDQFWNPQEMAFTHAFLKDQQGTLRGFSQFVPLLWKGLPHTQKVHILETIHESGKLPGGLSVLTWRKSAMDDNSFPLLLQMLVFQALKISDPHGQLLNDFSRITLRGFVEWHTLAVESEKRLPITPQLGAFIMNIQALRQYRYHSKGPITGYFFKVMRKVKGDRFDLGVIAATIFAVFSVHLIYGVLKAPPPLEMLEAQMNSAYAERDIEGTLGNAMAIIKHYPDDNDVALHLAANISILRGSYEDAAILYEKVRLKYPDSPGPMIGLGLAYQLQGRFDEAEATYYEFCYIFEEIFPELVDAVNNFRYLMQEGFKTPPKWTEIYRYQIMHEL